MELRNWAFTMKQVKELTRFYSAIRDDSRIKPMHICMYMALFQFYNLNSFKNPVEITRAQVMASAKINGKATYHKCIKELVAFGYIQYEPSYNPGIASRMFLLKV